MESKKKVVVSKHFKYKPSLLVLFSSYSLNSLVEASTNSVDKLLDLLKIIESVTKKFSILESVQDQQNLSSLPILSKITKFIPLLIHTCDAYSLYSDRQDFYSKADSVSEIIKTELSDGHKLDHLDARYQFGFSDMTTGLGLISSFIGAFGVESIAGVIFSALKAMDTKCEISRNMIEICLGNIEKYSFYGMSGSGLLDWVFGQKYAACYAIYTKPEVKVIEEILPDIEIDEIVDLEIIQDFQSY